MPADTLVISRVRRHLLDRMLSGHLEPGDRLGLPDIARRLAISVTPVRGALNQLSYSGLVSHRDKSGFRLDAPTSDEARRLYHTVVALETEALREGHFNATIFAELRNLNSVLAQAADAPSRFRADFAWHQALCRYFADTAAAHWLEDLKVRLYLFERAYFQTIDHLEVAVAQHEAIVTALERGDSTSACETLRQNWLAIDALLASSGSVNRP